MCLSMRDHVHAYMSVSAHAREKARATAREYAGFFFSLLNYRWVSADLHISKGTCDSKRVCWILIFLVEPQIDQGAS